MLTHPDEKARLTNMQLAQNLLAVACTAQSGNPVDACEHTLDRRSITQLLHFMISREEELAAFQKLNQQSVAINRSREIQLASHELLELARSPHAVIVIDEEQWRMNPSRDIQTVPFMERNGEFWGLPADDACAIAELERMRLPATRFLAVFQPSFWWLEHYRAFSHHLHATSQLVFTSERMLLFELFGAGKVIESKRKGLFFNS